MQREIYDSRTDIDGNTRVIEEAEGRKYEGLLSILNSNSLLITHFHHFPRDQILVDSERHPRSIYLTIPRNCSESRQVRRLNQRMMMMVNRICRNRSRSVSSCWTWSSSSMRSGSSWWRWEFIEIIFFIFFPSSSSSSSSMALLLSSTRIAWNAGRSVVCGCCYTGRVDRCIRIGRSSSG